MPITTKTFRIALTAAALCAAASVADAKPRRVVILDFDGPRGLADTGRSTVVSLLGEQYDVVATKRWEDARASAQQKLHGPTSWQKAAKTSGVDAVIEGWIQDEGRHKVLTVAVREASTGNEIDSVSVKLGAKGLGADGGKKLMTELDGVLAYIDASPDASGGQLPVIPRKMLGAKDPADETARPARVADEDDAETKPTHKKKRAEVADAPDDAEPAPKHASSHGRTTDDDGEPAPKHTRKSADADKAPEGDSLEETVLAPKKEVATRDPQQDNNDLVQLFGPKADELPLIDKKLTHIPVATPRFEIDGGGYYGSRSLTFAAENQQGPQAYAGVPSKGLELAAAVYPFPLKKVDGQLSGIGFSFAVSKSAGSVVTFDDLETVADYTIDQTAWKAAVHWRQPISDLISIDSEVNYGKSTYIIQDAPTTFEVPDTDYSYLGAGAHLTLNVTEHTQIGFGGRYLYLLDTGDISSVDWYGPGRAGGWTLDGNFKIPLPENLYIRGQLEYTHIGIEFDGVGQITEDEGVSESSDATVNGSVHLGIEF